MGREDQSQVDDHLFDDSEDEYTDDDGDAWEDLCGLGHDGQCSQAGTEHCDFCCPARNSEFFAGSAAWNEKHKPTRRKAPIE